MGIVKEMSKLHIVEPELVQMLQPHTIQRSFVTYLRKDVKLQEKVVWPLSLLVQDIRELPVVAWGILEQTDIVKGLKLSQALALRNYVLMQTLL